MSKKLRLLIVGVVASLVFVAGGVQGCGGSTGTGDGTGAGGASGLGGSTGMGQPQCECTNIPGAGGLDGGGGSGGGWICTEGTAPAAAQSTCTMTYSCCILAASTNGSLCFCADQTGLLTCAQIAAQVKGGGAVVVSKCPQ
jgi:hypothetical protein